MVVRHNAQTVQYIARVVIVRYRTISKRPFTQQLLFIIHLSIIQHIMQKCLIFHLHYQYKTKLHATLHPQNNISLSGKTIVTHQTLYKLTIHHTITTLYTNYTHYTHNLYHLTAP